jgi:hypothetical protein
MRALGGPTEKVTDGSGQSSASVRCREPWPMLSVLPPSDVSVN